ncbi:MAG: hypothetical protein RIB78_05420 [Gammaproteobacteria bacterium]
MKLEHKIGALFFSIHILIFIVFVLYLHFVAESAQARLLWVFWLPLDFPVSLLTLWGLDNLNNPSGLNLVAFLFPYFIHGLLGAIWWFFLTSKVFLLLKKIQKK